VSVTVAIPVRDGGELLRRTLTALSTQTVAHELLVCDSGSVDGSDELAASHGARVLRIAPARFNHGGTRNLLVRESSGARVALLSQDAEPADERWLERLLAGFDLAPDVGIVCGSYRPRAGASLPTRMELERWFASLSRDGRPCVERLDARERSSLPAAALVGRRGFFTDANACLSRPAWEQVPFRELAYAEDRALALDMLRAGYAKVYVPAAAVIHSHDYTPGQQLRRCFDEWRGLREVYGWREPASPGHLLGRMRGELAAARRELSLAEAPAPARWRTLAAVTVHNALRLTGAVLGSRAELLPARVRRVLSLERRGEASAHAGGTPAPASQPQSCGRTS